MEQVAIYIPDQNYECYFFKNNWKVIHEDKVMIISIESFFSYPFYVIFENIEVVSEQLKNLSNKYQIRFTDIFPLQLILKDIIDHQQGYWLNLCLDFIIMMNYLDKNIIEILNVAKKNKYFSQSLKNKIKKVLSLDNGSDMELLD